MATLITGGTGFLGSYLAKELVAKGEDVVLFDVFINHKLISSIEKNVTLVRGDLASWTEVLSVVKKYGIKKIFHCGALLSHSAEDNPLKAYEVNLLGTWYVLEAAKLFDVEKVLFTSTIASFGAHITDPTPNTAPQYPRTLYGVSKVSSERLGEYYKIKFNIDFRGVRFPSVIGPLRGPGGASAYSSLMIEKPALGEPYDVYVEPRCRIPLLYVKDAVKAMIQLIEAKEENLNFRMYNIAGISPTAGEVAEAVQKVLPQAKLSFLPDPDMVKIVDSWPNALEDIEAQKDWSWKADYDLEKTVADFVSELQKA